MPTLTQATVVVGTDITAAQLVTRAWRALGLLNLYEAAPQPPMMSEGLSFLGDMIDGWAKENSLNVVTQIISGSTTNDSAVITDLATTAKLAIGMNVSGTGIAANSRILSIDSPTQVTLDTDATAGGSSISLTFTAIPFPLGYQTGIMALLAQRLALLGGEDNIPAMVNKMASDGWMALQANYCPATAVVFDAGLTATTTTRRNVV